MGTQTTTPTSPQDSLMPSPTDAVANQPIQNTLSSAPLQDSRPQDNSFGSQNDLSSSQPSMPTMADSLNPDTQNTAIPSELSQSDTSTAVPPAPTFPPVPTDFSSENNTLSQDALNTPITSAPQPSIFSANPPADDTTEDTHTQTPSAFFTNTTPENNSLNQDSTTSTDSFAPLPSMEPTADTSFATDSTIGTSPVTPYTTPQASPQFPQPLPSPSDVVNANTPHETSAITKVIYILAAVIFFTVYTVFWIKVFNIPFIF